MNLTLSIAHNIFLKSEERYLLHIGKEIEVIGVSTPVWFYKKTSEPANELFCKYKITPTESTLFIKHNATKGYDLCLPRLSYDAAEKRNNPITLKSLLDFKDGGVEWLAFHQFNDVKRNNKDIHIAQFIEMKDMEELIQTIS